MSSLQLANCAAATGNARSPTVDSRVDGTSNADVRYGYCSQALLSSDKMGFIVQFLCLQ